MAFALWGTESNFFKTGGSAITGQHWDRSQRVTNFGIHDPVWVDTATSSVGYVSTASLTYTIYITAQDGLGNQSDAIAVATTTMINPFNSPAGGAQFTSVGGVSTGAVFWFAASTTVVGAYDIKFQGFTDTLANIGTATQPITLAAGNPVNLETAIVSPTNYTYTYNSTNFVLAYESTASATTKNVFLQSFDTLGNATTTLQQVGAGVAKGQAYTLNGTSTGGIRYFHEDNTAALAAIDLQTYDPMTGLLGVVIAGVTDLNDIYALDARYSSSGNFFGVVEGVVGTTHKIEANVFNASFGAVGPGFSTTLVSASSIHWQAQAIQSNGVDEYVLIYADNSHVHMELFDANGNQIGSDFLVGTLAGFDRIAYIGDGRVEISYRPGTGGLNNVASYIYDTRTAAVNLAGTSGADNLAGTTFNDTFTASTGNDKIAGGPGTDTVDYSALGTALTVTLSGLAGTVAKGGANGTDTLTGIENIVGTNTSSVYSLAGGVYQVTGGTASDLYFVDNSSDVIVEQAGGGAGDAVFATANYVLPTNVEGLYLLPGATSGTGNNNVNGNSLIAAYDYVGVTLTSGGANTYFYGSALADTLVGGAGTNTFYGWAGADNYFGGTASNYYYVTDAGTVIHEAATHGTDVVYSALASYTLPTGVNIVFTYTDSNPITGLPVVGQGATGNGGNDAFIGVYATVSQTFTATGSGSNTFIASSHGDTFNGSTGNDTFFGGAGNDTMHGGGGVDTFFLTHAGSTADDIAGSTAVIYAGFNYALTTGTHTDVLFIYGSATTAIGNNEGNLIVGSYISTGATLTGGTGNDQIIGGAGNDIIDGKGGIDSLSGAGGNDTFTFHAGYGNNTITDFAATGAGADKVDVHLMFANFAAVQAAAAQVGADTVITSGTDHLTLKAVTVGTLTATDFVF